MTTITSPPPATAPPVAPDRVRLGVLAVVLAFVGLSLGSTIAKSTGAPGPVVAFWRFLVAAALWHGHLARRHARGRGRPLDRRAWRLAAPAGVAFGINLSCFFAGATRTPIAHAEFISALTPIALVPLAAWRLHERVQRHVLVAGAVALGGVALILGHASSGETSLVGDALVVASVAAWITYLVLARTARAQLDTATFMAAMTTTACATAAPLALVTAGGLGGIVALSARAWLLVLVLALTAGVGAHGLIVWAQQRVAVGTISLLQLAQPALGTGWAALLLGESVSAAQLAGMALVLGAVGTIARRVVPPAPAQASASSVPSSRHHAPR